MGAGLAMIAGPVTAAAQVLAAEAHAMGASQGPEAVDSPPGLTGADDFERQVYERYYRENVERNYVRYYSDMSYEDVQADETAKRYEIDPAEFGRDLPAKQAALEHLRARRVAECRDAPVSSAEEQNLASYITKLTDARYYRNMGNSSRLLTVAKACVQIPKYRDDDKLRLQLYRRAGASLKGVLAAPKWTSACFTKPRQAAVLYYTLHDLIEADKDDEALREAATELEKACEEVVYLAWVFPLNRNSEMRLKRPYSVNTFRYSTRFTVGNFGYRFVVDCALVRRDTKMLDIIKRVVLLSLQNVTSYNTHADTFWFNQGFMADGTGTAHGRQSYAFGYVDDYVQGGAYRNAELLRGTPWDIGIDHWDLVANFLLEAEQWIVYRGRVDYSLNGRHNLYAPEYGSQNYAFSGDTTVKLLTEKVLELSAGTVKQRPALETMLMRLENKQDLEGNRYWWCTEDLIQRRKGFYFLANLSSVRIAGPENARSSAEKNYYFGDGATMILSSGEEYDYVRGAWNMSALPGTTAADQPVPYENTWIGFYGQNIYSGGVSNGRNGAAAFRCIKDGVKVKAQKAYFACDYTVVALGYLNENDAGTPVLTTLNQTAWNTDIACRANGRMVTFGKGSAVGETLRSADTLAFWQDRIGYLVVPAAETEVRLTAETRRTDWQDLARKQKGVPNRDVDIMHLAVVHGDRDTFAADSGSRRTYQYVLQAQMARDAFDSFAEQPPVTILANGPEVQAVRFDGQRITQAAFYQAATLTAGGLSLTVDRPAIVMLDESTAGTVAVTVADPLQSPMTDTLTLTVGIPLRGPGALVSNGRSILTVAMPTQPLIGKSVTHVYRRR